MTIFNGVWARGVFGAVRAVTHSPLRSSNERWLLDRFEGASTFAVLMRVSVVRNQVATPDLRLPETRLFEWSRS